MPHGIARTRHVSCLCGTARARLLLLLGMAAALCAPLRIRTPCPLVHHSRSRLLSEGGSCLPIRAHLWIADDLWPKKGSIREILCKCIFPIIIDLVFLPYIYPICQVRWIRNGDAIQNALSINERSISTTFCMFNFSMKKCEEYLHKLGILVLDKALYIKYTSPDIDQFLGP